MLDRLHLSLLHVYRRLPTKGRRLVVRTISPSFTVGSMCFIERDDGAMLLVRHVYRSRWGVPGGLLKRGEDADDAARREVFEEVGLAVELVGEPAVVVDAPPQRVDIVFRARPVVGIDPEDVAPGSPEIVEVRWFPPEQLPELQHETSTALVALARSSHSPQAPASSVPAPPGQRSDPG
ncbi:MAG: putative MutT/NUDIX-family protein [Acidimicrobiales bacterium]|nr:putative MutT/NUDIX-family protein [Acidimicrobiales bacterium]